MQDNTLTPLRWLSDSQRNQLVARIRDACAQVLSDWNAAAGTSLPAVRYSSDRRSVMGTTYVITIDSKVMAKWFFEPDTVRQLLRLPSDSQVSIQDSANFLNQLELDLVDAMSRQLLTVGVSGSVGTKRATEQDLKQFGRNGIRHVFDIGDDGRSSCCQLELSPALINLLMPRASPCDTTALTPRKAAIGNETLTLNAMLGHIELSFKELHGLTIGDVLVMDEALTTPVIINSATGQRVADGMLGRYKTQLALQIANLSAPNISTKRSMR